jgi:hypothetical protein
MNFMPFRKALVRLAWTFGTVSLIWTPLMSSPVSDKTRTDPAVDSSYVSALAAADHFLQAWHSGDVEHGIVLLSSHAKSAATSDTIEIFFSNPQPCAYEITRGKALKNGRYEFPVVLVCDTANSRRAHRHFSKIVIVNTGNNDWAVDNLP